MQPIQSRLSSDSSLNLKEPPKAKKQQIDDLEKLSLRTLGEPDLEEWLAVLPTPIKKKHKVIPLPSDLYSAKVVFEQKRTGVFKVIYNTEEQFEGEFVDGVPHGLGKSFWRNGKIHYEGRYHNNRAHGRGKTYRKNGTLLYSGEFVNNLFHGFGVYYDEYGVLFFEGYWYMGLIYRGQMQGGKPEGEGTLSYLNGDFLYRGRWRDGVPHGDGVEYLDRQSAKVGIWYCGFRYVGNWEDGKPHGLGALFDFRGVILYLGLFDHGKSQGYGKQFFAGKLMYEGGFFQGKFHGFGTFYDEYGEIVCFGQWVDGFFQNNV